MRQSAVIIMVALFTSMAAGQARKRNAPRYNDPIDNYTTVEVEGWTLLVNKRLDKHPEVRRELLETVRHELWTIKRIVPAKAVTAMQKTRIWVEYKNTAGAQYHPGRDWLVENNYNPKKVRCVDIGNAASYIDRIPGRAVMTLLHELAHAYHHQVLDFDNEKIVAVYERAKKAGLYDKVMRDRHVVVKHYALVNEKEFFAEMSEAYLWVNDYYPFNRAELKKVDPQTYKLMEAIWGRPTPTEKELRKREKRLNSA